MELYYSTKSKLTNLFLDKDLVDKQNALAGIKTYSVMGHMTN
jgi:hypothetical protein